MHFYNYLFLLIQLVAVDILAGRLVENQTVTSSRVKIFGVGKRFYLSVRQDTALTSLWVSGVLVVLSGVVVPVVGVVSSTCTCKSRTCADPSDSCARACVTCAWRA
jgi:hypothetical protein